jgi:hypothetical protein
MTEPFFILLTTALVGFFVSIYTFTTHSPRVCPTPEDIQSPFVKNEYEEAKHQGFYYELAFKDVTQPRVCKCITSNKTIISEDTLQDDFNIQCAEKVYNADLSFDLNVDNRRGYMIGRWNSFSPLKGVSFPNTIVDVGVNPKTGEYDWAIEFQCKQGQTIFGYDRIQYSGLNFYSKQFDDPNLVQLMEHVSQERGLGPFLDTGLSLFVVDHTGCLQDH